MPHKNYCQQCQKTVSSKRHNKTHTIIPDVADRLTYPILKVELPPVSSPSETKKKLRDRRKK